MIEKRKPGRPRGTGPKPKYTERLLVYLDTETATKLYELAQAEGIGQSEYVRRLIRQAPDGKTFADVLMGR